MWMQTPEPSETPDVVYLFSDVPWVQNVMFVLVAIAAVGSAVGVVAAAVRFVVRPIRQRWLNRVQLHAEITSPARYNNIVSPRGWTVPRVVVTVTNMSLVRTLPKAQLETSTLPGLEPSDQGDFKPEARIEIWPPLAESHLRAKGSSDITAPDNWTYAETFTVTLSWETKRISATESRRKQKTWTFNVADVKGVRPER